MLDLQGITRVGYSSNGDSDCSGGGSSSSGSARKWSSKAPVPSNNIAEKTDSYGLAEFAYNDHCSCSSHNGTSQCMYVFELVGIN